MSAFSETFSSKPLSYEALRLRSVEALEFSKIREKLAEFTYLPMSREMAMTWRVEYEPELIKRLQAETLEARTLISEAGDLAIASDRDIRSVLYRAERGGTLTGEELWAVSDVLDLVKRVKSTGTRLQGKTPLLRNLARNIPNLVNLHRDLRAKVSSAGTILDDATPYLRELRTEARTKYKKAAQSIEALMDKPPVRDILQERLITLRADRLVLPIKIEFQAKIKGIIHDRSDSEATVFIEPLGVIELGNAWKESLLAEESETQRILRQLSVLISRHCSELWLALDLAAKIDLILAKARYANSIGGAQIELAESNIPAVRIVAALHPLLGEGAIPLFMAMEEDIHCLIITGPNTGGKTVALKTVGLMALMHQSGLHPAVQIGTRLPVFDAIFADIGDLQDISHSTSTFSSHMTNIVDILSAATFQSLVLLDELGTSTDPEEGAALAKAIMSDFDARSVTTIATTHHRELAAFAEKRSGINNASVELDPSTLDPTYRLTIGIPGRSYAITIAQHLGPPDRLVKAAISYQNPAQIETEKLLVSMEEERHRTRLRLNEAEAIKENAERLKIELEQNLSEVAYTRTQIVEQTRLELMGQVKEVLEGIQQAQIAVAWQPVQPTLSQQMISAEPLLEIQKRLKSKKWGNLGRQSRINELKIGDSVRVGSFGFIGTVTSLPDDQKRMEVLVGNVRVRINFDDLYKLTDKKTTKNSDSLPIQLKIDRTAIVEETELDVRGMRVSQSLEKIDIFIDRSVTQGRESVVLIHGKGTGMLRQGIWKHLAYHPSVQSYDYSEPGQGGEGATVVHLA